MSSHRLPLREPTQQICGLFVPATPARTALFGFRTLCPYTAATSSTIATASPRMKRSMPAPWSMPLIVPIRCCRKERITTWWKFGPAIAGCIALRGVARRKPPNDSLVDFAAVRNRQSFRPGDDLPGVRHGHRSYPKRKTRADTAGRIITFARQDKGTPDRIPRGC